MATVRLPCLKRQLQRLPEAGRLARWVLDVRRCSREPGTGLGIRAREDAGRTTRPDDPLLSVLAAWLPRDHASRSRWPTSAVGCAELLCRGEAGQPPGD